MSLAFNCQQPLARPKEPCCTERPTSWWPLDVWYRCLRFYRPRTARKGSSVMPWRYLCIPRRILHEAEDTDSGMLHVLIQALPLGRISDNMYWPHQPDMERYYWRASVVVVVKHRNTDGSPDVTWPAVMWMLAYNTPTLHQRRNAIAMQEISDARCIFELDLLDMQWVCAPSSRLEVF